MQALEAMQRLIEAGRLYVDHHVGAELGIGLTEEEKQEDVLVTEACDTAQLMLDTALPVARWRCHVHVDTVQPVKKPDGIKGAEYTICSPSILSVIVGLIGLSQVRTDVHITLWEQQVSRAEMVSGFQGPSKTAQYRLWLQGLRALQDPKPPVN